MLKAKRGLSRANNWTRHIFSYNREWNRKYGQNVIIGNKKFLYCKNIKAVKVHQIEQLSIKDLVNWRIESTDIDQYVFNIQKRQIPWERMTL